MPLSVEAALDAAHDGLCAAFAGAIGCVAGPECKYSLEPVEHLL